MSPSALANAFIPTINMGRFAPASILEKLCSPCKICSSNNAELPKYSTSYVKSYSSPIRAIGNRVSNHRFLILAFKTGASHLGLVPISKTASASSIPAIVELNK